MSKIIEVRPISIVSFSAIRWDGELDTLTEIESMANQYRWKVNGIMMVTVRNRQRRALTITGRNRKQYRALKGDWIIALGQNGSIRVCSDKQFRQDYKETGQ